MPAPSAITAPAVGDPTRQEFAQGIVDWIAWFNSLASSRDAVLNGSFEQDSDADGIPDAWTRTLQTNGVFSVQTSTVSTDDKSAHGAKSIKFTSTGGGNGGGNVTTTDFIECTENKRIVLTWQQKGTADVKNLVEVDWYDSTQSYISTSTVYSEATNNPTTWTTLSGEGTAPNNARYLKLRFVGCDSSDSTAGDTWFDDIRAFHYPRRRTTEQLDSSTTWTCPADVTYAFMEAWGAGGGGVNSNTGGGGGGEYRCGWFTVVPGRGYTVTRGAGGGVSSAGGDTTIQDSVTTTVLLLAIGGSGGSGASGGNGGTGGTNGTFTIDGQKGGGTGSSCGGSSGRGGFGGIANGAAGSTPGGGGAGNGGGTAGSGANGRVAITYGLDW